MAQLPEKFDTYFRDAFGYRDQLIRWHHIFTIKELRESPVPNVIVGGHGRLFYAGYGDGIDIGDFSGQSVISAAALDAYLAHQVARHQQYAAAGARYLIALVPNKQTVYPDDVPDHFGPHRSGNFDAVLRRFAGRPDVDVLDLRPILTTHRDEPAYYATDSHWNSNGAFWAASAIVDRVRPWFPALAPLRRSDYDVTHHKDQGHDLRAMLAMTHDLDEQLWTYARHGDDKKHTVAGDVDDAFERPEHALPRVLIYSDSFGAAVAPFLGDVFGRVRHYNSAHAGYNAELVAQEKPDLVVLLLCERYLTRLADQ